VLTVQIHNLSGDDMEHIADYEYKVLVNSHVIADGLMCGHQRNLGWIALLQRLMDKEVMKEDYDRRVKQREAIPEEGM